jgi:hypothetical protein
MYEVTLFCDALHTCTPLANLPTTSRATETLELPTYLLRFRFRFVQGSLRARTTPSQRCLPRTTPFFRATIFSRFQLDHEFRFSTEGESCTAFGGPLHLGSQGLFCVLHANPCVTSATEARPSCNLSRPP